MFAFQHGELLAQGEILKHQAAMGTKGSSDDTQPQAKQVEHEARLSQAARLPSHILDLKAGRNCDEGQTRAIPSTIGSTEFSLGTGDQRGFFCEGMGSEKAGVSRLLVTYVYRCYTATATLW
jgi:hypothetical protein